MTACNLQGKQGHQVRRDARSWLGSLATIGHKLKWTLETSILSRQGDILKQHKQILAYPYGNVITNMLYGAHGKEIIEGASKLALRTEATAMLNECERSLNLGGRSYPGLS